MRTLYHLWLHPSSRKVRIALADLLVPPGAEPVYDLDEMTMAAQLDAEIQGKVSVSEAILAERREGP